MIAFNRIKPRSAAPDITPLLDVVFILLIFFVVSTVFTTRGMEMELPSANSSTPVYGKSLEIELHENGDLLCDALPISSDALSNRLRVIAERPFAQQPQNILFKSAPHADVVDFVGVVDMVRTHGFSNLVIVTRPTDPPNKAEGEQ